MQRLSATDAARRFSDLLDAVERDRETFVVVRRGREVATIGPAASATGHQLKKILSEHRPDPAWSKELRSLRESLAPDRDPWSA